MSKLKWDLPGEREYETGVSHGVLYVMDKGAYGPGVPWNGLTAVTEAPSGAEPTAIYADNIKYLTMMSAEEFGGTIEAYMSPAEFDACDGSTELTQGLTIGQQPRKSFGLCYQTILGNDTLSNEYGVKYHFVYNALAAPSEKAYATVNESPEAMTLSWEFTTTPIEVSGHKPTSIATIKSTDLTPEQIATLEAMIYGDTGNEAMLPTPTELATLLA